jgi:hypothetical protein
MSGGVSYDRIGLMTPNLTSAPLLPGVAQCPSRISLKGPLGRVFVFGLHELPPGVTLPASG